MQTNVPANLRRRERKPAKIPISLVLKTDPFKVRHAATTIDISMIGVGVRTELALVSGQRVEVVPEGEFPHAIPSRVVWVGGDVYGPWTVAGLEFSIPTEV